MAKKKIKIEKNVPEKTENLKQLETSLEKKIRFLERKVDDISYAKTYGKIISAVGTTIKTTLTNLSIGDFCEIVDASFSTKLYAEVVSLDKNAAVLLPLGAISNLSKDDLVTKSTRQHSIKVGDFLLGKTLDGFGNLTGSDEDIHLQEYEEYPINAPAPDPLQRPILSTPFVTSIRSIDLFTTCAQGQRLAIFAGPGIGKTTLMGMIIRGSEADVVVIALIGERGREVKEFIDLEINNEIRKKTVLVVSTSDKSPVEQVKSAFVAQTVAEYFRNQGKRVMLFVDSITRFARAQREVGLSAGEPVTRGGFPPSVFLSFPKLMERAGNNPKGSITAFYTVLMEGDHTSGDPIADEVRSIIDGHIILSRKLAEQGHYPAIDILASLSRVADRIISKEHVAAARKIRLLLSKYDDTELLIRLGEYKVGTDKLVDESIKKRDQILNLLKQNINEKTRFDMALKNLIQIANM